MTTVIFFYQALTEKHHAINWKIIRYFLSSNRPELAEDFMREATAGDYNHLLITRMRYVTIK